MQSKAPFEKFSVEHGKLWGVTFRVSTYPEHTKTNEVPAEASRQFIEDAIREKLERVLAGERDAK